MSGLVGGEGMTEALRDYLEERFNSVYSGYGACDLTIGMARRERFHRLAAPAAAHRRRAARRRARRGRAPPADGLPVQPARDVPGDDPEGELLCTINSTDVLSPRLRYNIGDEARLRSFPEVTGRDPGRRPGRADGLAGDDAALLFLFGRRDHDLVLAQPSRRTSTPRLCPLQLARRGRPVVPWLRDAGRRRWSTPNFGCQPQLRRRSPSPAPASCTTCTALTGNPKSSTWWRGPSA